MGAKLDQPSSSCLRPKHALLPHSLQKQAEMLFEQQMWCWGCDVRREAGNLLLAYGFRKRPALESRTSSAYTCLLHPDGALTLWGWGLWIAAQGCGSLLISRDGFRLRGCAEAIYEPQAWREADLLPSVAPVRMAQEYAADTLLVQALTWIALYEDWLTTQVEPTYRTCALAAWPQRRRCKGGVPAHEMAARWALLAHSLSMEYLNP